MTPMRTRRATRRAAALAASLAVALLAAGCGAGHPSPISARELSEAQTFPYYRVYWVGPSFAGQHLSAADGLRGYIEKIGDSVYYGDCVKSKGIFGGGSCVLPLQVTTVIYRLHSNAPLGPQRNIVVRGVPATVYDEGRSIEIYTGRVAIDVFSNSFPHALAAARRLLPINAPGSATGALPAPVYCPGLAGQMSAEVASVMAALPRQSCRQAAAAEAFADSLST
jgi:ABC-type glycerol-3-phosphate transport system substrate-binding protein